MNPFSVLESLSEVNLDTSMMDRSHIHLNVENTGFFVVTCLPLLHCKFNFQGGSHSLVKVPLIMLRMVFFLVLYSRY